MTTASPSSKEQKASSSKRETLNAAAPEDDPKDEFISEEDILPHLVKLSKKVLPIGVALGVKDFAVAELDKGGDRQEACLRVFGHYFEQKQMTWKKLCDVLRLVNMGTLANEIANTKHAGPTKNDRVQLHSHSKLGILFNILIGVGISVFAVVVFLLFCDVKLKPEYGGPPLPHREVQSNRFARSDDKLPEDFTIVDPSFAPLYRYWHGRVSDHFYTTNVGEIGECQKNKVGRHDYKAEGIAAIIHTQQFNGTVPLYRHYSGQLHDHFYTTDENENLSSYKYEGIAGYCYGNHTNGTFPLHRYYKDGVKDHFYTLNMDEIGTVEIGQIGKHGYKYEGVQCYVYRSGV